MKPSSIYVIQLYGLPKVHKVATPARPIVSAFRSHTVNLNKQLVPIISYLSTSQYILLKLVRFC